MAAQQWKSKVQRWHQLSRYYVNKWQYDGSKWADRIWYGTGTSKPVDAVASVPFMITRNMRMELEKLGFPGHEISALLPKVAHELLNDKVSYATYVQQRATLQSAAASSAVNESQVAKHQQQQQQEQNKEIMEFVATIQAREQTQATHDDHSHGNTSSSSIETSVAIVPETLNQPQQERL